MTPGPTTSLLTFKEWACPHQRVSKGNCYFFLTPSSSSLSPNKALAEFLLWPLINFYWLRSPRTLVWRPRAEKSLKKISLSPCKHVPLRPRHASTNPCLCRSARTCWYSCCNDLRAKYYWQRRSVVRSSPSLPGPSWSPCSRLRCRTAWKGAKTNQLRISRDHSGLPSPQLRGLLWTRSWAPTRWKHPQPRPWFPISSSSNKDKLCRFDYWQLTERKKCDTGIKVQEEYCDGWKLLSQWAGFYPPKKTCSGVSLQLQHPFLWHFLVPKQGI